MALPLVGPKQVGEVRLAPQLRQRYRRRAFGLARQEYRPAIAADRAALQSVRHQRRTDVRSVAGATNLAEQAITGATKALRKSGLPGAYRGQVAQALSTRAADVASSAPALASTVRQGYASDVASAKGAILADRAQLQKTGQETLYSELGKARTQGRAFIAKQAKREAKAKTHKRNVEQKAAQHHGELRQAVTRATNLYIQGPGGKNANGQPLPWKPPYTSQKDWSKFVSAVLAGEGVTHGNVAEHGAQRAVFIALNHHMKQTGLRPVGWQFFQRWLKKQLGDIPTG